MCLSDWEDEDPVSEGRYYNQPVNYGGYNSLNPVTQSNYTTQQDIGSKYENTAFNNFHLHNHGSSPQDESQFSFENTKNTVTVRRRPYHSSFSANNLQHSTIHASDYNSVPSGESFIRGGETHPGNIKIFHNTGEAWRPSFSASQFIGPVNQGSRSPQQSGERNSNKYKQTEDNLRNHQKYIFFVCTVQCALQNQRIKNMF